MVVKVLKRGQAPGEPVIRFHCRNCHSELEAARADFIVTLDRGDTFYSLKCPVCQEFVTNQNPPGGYPT